MALINCPECQREVSDRAPGCPQCGYPIASRAASAASPPPPPAAPESSPVPVMHLQHDDRAGFSKGIERGLEDVGRTSAQGCVAALVVIALVAVLGVVLLVRSATVCKECDGKGRIWGGLRECPACKGTGKPAGAVGTK